MTLILYWIKSIYYFAYRGVKSIRLWLWIRLTPEGKQSAWIYTNKGIKDSQKGIKHRLNVKHATGRLLVKKGGIISDMELAEQPTKEELQ